jgi:maleate isomerase
VPAPNYGVRARLGIMLPASNAITEPTAAAILPAGVSLLATRMWLRHGPDQLNMLEQLESLARLLADAKVDRIIFHCTAISMYRPDIPGHIRERIAAITPIPVVITSETIVDALRVLGARKIVLVTPYHQDTNDFEAAFLAHNGITVLRDRALDCDNAVEMYAVEPERWVRETIAMADPEADAYVLSCTTIRAVEAIEAIERELGKPVVTSNQGMLWGALRSAGVRDAIDGCGRLLRDF